MVKKNSFKYLIGYTDNDVLMIGYVKHFDSNKTTSFKANDNRLLNKYTKIWERVSSLMNIELDSKPVYGDSDKYIKTNIYKYI